MNNGNNSPDEQPVGSETPAPVSTTEQPDVAAQLAEANERTLRLRADYDNFRKRAERERMEVFDLAAMEAVRAILPALDDFERALGLGPPPSEGADEYAKGIELIYQRLMDALVKLGLQPVEAEGKSFDPNVHHAVKTEQRDDVPDHTVIEQYQRGYSFRGKPLRPAMVKVSVTS